MTTTKRSFLTSLVALLVLLSMFVGTTFAWFTDTASSNGNVIKTGNLDILLKKGTPDGNGGWTWTENNGEAIFDYDKWEPGYTTYAALAVENVGSLEARITAKINLNGAPTILGEVIDVYTYVGGFDNYDPSARPDFSDTAAWLSLGSIADIFNGTSAILPERNLPAGQRARMIVALHMREDAGNEYQDMDLGANFDIKIIATQATAEFDSFDDQYDKDAEWPYVAIKYHVGQKVEAEKITVDDATGTATLSGSVNIGAATDDIRAEIPAGVTLADGATELTLKVESMETPTQDIDLEPGEVARSIDVHVDGVSEDNTTPMLITLNKLFSAGLNDGNARIIHVENGQPVEMTKVATLAELDAHNEFYYDVDTGDVVISIASFSEITPIENDYNNWNGGYDTSWYNTTDKEFTLINEDQVAGFGAIVDGGYKKKDGTSQTLTPDTFEGKTIFLGENIDLYGIDEDGNRVSFNPIGYSYSYKGGQVFKGTFDGDGHTISNLYINGWDIGLSYSMAGGGFFASVEDAIIQDVTFSNAEIVMECIEQGVVAGLATGNCTFENINIYGCSVANYQRATGGVVGEVNPYRNNSGIIDEENPVVHKFTNINIDSTTVIGSLWGDFDAPVGGVIGAKWDDSKGVTNVEMNNVNVACRLDVYNDVTSTYQWYAYRRAGMLIGNTEDAVTVDGHTVASADFLKCENVNVYYGDWVDYHYCEFSEDYNSPSWPFVRVEAGENCNAYSNPRWGVATDANGNAITDAHTKENHTGDDGCRVHLPFNQLYGGGQGVYGEDSHENVNTKNYIYSIQYINDNKLLAETFVESNDSAYDIYGKDNDNNVVSYGNGASAQTKVEDWLLTQGYKEDEIVFGGWVNAGSTKMPTILAGNTTNVKLYPYFNSPYTARFVDSYGNVIAWCLFHSEKTSDLDSTANAAQAALPGLGEDFGFDYWEVHVTDDDGNTTSTTKYTEFDFSKATTDVTIYPVYKYNGDVTLIPVDSDGDGEINHYKVAGYSNPNGQALVEIPGTVNGKPILEISGGAFSSYDGVHSITIPKDVTYIGDNAFAEKWSGITDSGETITIYYGGSYSDWVEKEKSFGSNWESGISSSTRIFFLNGGDTVDVGEGYLQAAVENDWGTRTVNWSHNTSITSAIVEEYTGHCDCEISTTGDTAHIYVRVNADGTETIMKHNANGTPVNEQGVEIYWGVIKAGWLGSIGEVKGLRDDDTNDTYERYRPDAQYWEGVDVN